MLLERTLVFFNVFFSSAHAGMLFQHTCCESKLNLAAIYDKKAIYFQSLLSEPTASEKLILKQQMFGKVQAYYNSE